MTRRARRAWFVGGLALLLVVTAIASPDVGSVYVGIGGIALALAWLAGFTRTPRAVRRALAQARREPRRTPEARPSVPERDFSAPSGAGRAVLVFGIGAAFLAALGVVVLVASSGARPTDRAAMVLPMALGVALFVHLARVTPRFGVRVGPWGIDSREMAGHIRIAWDDIVCVYGSTMYFSGGPYANALYVYSRDDVITLYSKTPGFEELSALIRAQVPAAAQL